MSKDEGPLSVEFWQERYRLQQTRWDLGEPAPPFVDFLAEPTAPTEGKVLVPGCGSGHDALFFAQRGFEVLGVDFAPAAIEICRQRAEQQRVAARFEVRDIFDLPQAYPHTFDYSLEHTIFCAIDPARRPAYVQMVRQVLRPGGKIIAIFFVHGRSGGPPFTTSVAEIQTLFGPYFTIERLEAARRSHPSRQNEEYFGLLKLKEENYE